MDKNIRNTYILTLELRYKVIVSDDCDDFDSEYRTKKIFIGAFRDIDSAVNYGNKTLDEMESMFPVIGKRSFDTKFGLPIQSNMGYLKTPFQFFLTVERYIDGNVEDIINNTIDEIEWNKNG